MRKPRRLHRGARVAAVTLSWGGPGTFPDRYEAGKRQFEERFGVQVVDMPHTCAPAEVVSSDPQARVDDLHAAFVDPDVDAVISAIGGEDSIRLLPLLDLDLLREHHKVFLGYSDSTIVQMAMLKAGLVTFYGPSLMAGLAENTGLHDYLADGIERMLFDDGTGAWPPNPDGWTEQFLDWANPANQSRARTLEPTDGWRWLSGTQPVTGRLVPACLEVLDWLRGTAYWPDLDGAVLALETSEEGLPPEGVARFLRVLAATGDLAKIEALLFARPAGVDHSTHQEFDHVLTDVVHDENGLDDLPMVTNLDFGHTNPIWTLPIGTEVKVDPTAGEIRFTESPTSP